MVPSALFWLRIRHVRIEFNSKQSFVKLCTALRRSRTIPHTKHTQEYVEVCRDPSLVSGLCLIPGEGQGLGGWGWGGRGPVPGRKATEARGGQPPTDGLLSAFYVPGCFCGDNFFLQFDISSLHLTPASSHSKHTRGLDMTLAKALHLLVTEWSVVSEKTTTIIMSFWTWYFPCQQWGCYEYKYSGWVALVWEPHWSSPALTPAVTVSFSSFYWGENAKYAE